MLKQCPCLSFVASNQQQCLIYFVVKSTGIIREQRPNFCPLAQAGSTLVHVMKCMLVLVATNILVDSAQPLTKFKNETILELFLHTYAHMPCHGRPRTCHIYQ